MAPQYKTVFWVDGQCVPRELHHSAKDGDEARDLALEIAFGKPRKIVKKPRIMVITEQVKEPTGVRGKRKKKTYG